MGAQQEPFCSPAKRVKMRLHKKFGKSTLSNLRVQTARKNDMAASRNNILDLSHIPNVGPATIRYLNILGINEPFELIGQNPYSMFMDLCETTGKQFDPCLADVFISAVRYMEGAPSHKWWHYTEEKIGRASCRERV